MNNHDMHANTHTQRITKGSTTVITGFFDLSTFSGPIRKPKSWYMDDAKKFTLRLALPMIIFTDEQDKDIILNIRKELGFEHLTHVITISLFDLPFWKLIPALEKLYSEKQSDERVKGYSPAYTALVNSKMQFIEKAMNTNPFSSDYFLWLDFGIGGRGYTVDIDMPYILKIAQNPKSKPSFAIISPDWMGNSKGRDYDGFNWIAAAGLITLPNNEISRKFLKDCQNDFERLVQEGHYVFEETIMFRLWKQNPDNFAVFYANYNTLSFKYSGNYPAAEAKKPRPECLKALNIV